MADYIKFPWYPDWFEWNTKTQEGRTFDHVITVIRNGKPYTKTVNGVDPLKWSTSKCDQRPHIHFRVDGKAIALHKYELIWMAHHMRQIPDGCVIHHIDFNKYNNEPSNLQLLTKEEHWKLHAEERSKAVVAVDEKGNVVHRFASTQEAGRHGFDQSHVSAACRGRFNREGNHYYKGYYWWYEQEWLRLH